MNFKKSIRRVLIAFVALTLLSTFVFADTIKLKDGSTVKGRISDFRDGKFTIVVGDGTRRKEFTFDADEVESIQFDRTGPEPTTQSVSKPVNAVTKPVIEEPAIVEEPVVKTPVQTATVTRPVSNSVAAKPIVLNINVLANDTSNGWTNSGWVVKKGQRIKIIGEGEVSLGKGNKAGPSGSYSLEDDSKLLKSVPTGALLAVIGDDNNDFIYIGSDREFVASRDGTLFLGLNEGNLKDNTGSFKVTIEISTDR